MKISAMVLASDIEPYMEYCLKSIEPIVDEIVWLSQSSMPRGMSADYAVGTDKNHMRFISQGRSEVDFSKWRNMVLDDINKQKNPADWILWLDADEIMAHSDGGPVTRKEIEGLIESNKEAENFLFPTLHFMYNYFTLDASGVNDHIHQCMRLFKNDGRRFKRKVHEFIDMKQEFTLRVNSPFIWHFGHCKGIEDLANRYRERHIKDNPFTGHMSKEELEKHFKTHNKLRGRIALARYDGPLPKIMGLW